MASIWVEHEYTASSRDEVALPEGVTFAQIQEWHVKWGCFHYTLDGETWCEVDMRSEVTVDDTKRPDSVCIYGVDGGGWADCDNVLAEE